MATIDFNIHVDDAADIAALFDRIQVWRASSQNGTYLDITSDVSLPALLYGSVVGPWNLNGTTLTVILNMADPVDINFTGTNPFQLGTVIAQVNAVIPGLASEIPTDTNKLKLTSSVVGTQSTLQVSGTAISVLGLQSTKVNGKGARPLIGSSTDDYLFRDFDGDNTFWYKTRYYNSVTGAVSAFSTPQMGGPGTGLVGSFVVTGKIALAALDGTPTVGRRIIFVPTGSQVVADGGGNNYGVLPSVDRITVTTDPSGQATVKLVKGQRLKVFIEGTTFQREFVVPTTDFDILTVATVQPDPLSIVTTPPFPIRLS